MNCLIYVMIIAKSIMKLYQKLWKISLMAYLTMRNCKKRFTLKENSVKNLLKGKIILKKKSLRNLLEGRLILKERLGRSHLKTMQLLKKCSSGLA